MEKPMCETCVYCEPDQENPKTEDSKGECRKYPPKHFDRWPPCEAYPKVKLQAWCGEHSDFPAWAKEKQ